MPRSAPRALLLSALTCLAGCGPDGQGNVAVPSVPTASARPQPLAEAQPVSRLPSDAKPTRYALTLRVDPKLARFEGAADITVELSRPRDVIWIHGRDLAVHRATVTPEGAPPTAAVVDARWEQVTPNGIAALHLPAAVGPGRVVVHVEYDAPWGKSDQGLSVVTRNGDAYAFSQFEATDARRAFPCFDEPIWKTPYAVTLVVPKGLGAMSNTRETSRSPDANPAWDRVSFAPTEPLPSYLVAMAVGALDVVAAPDLPPTALRNKPLPLRGIATRGRGKELAYTLAHTPEIVTLLESYFGMPYPYDKLDLFAVPEKNGAMENAGALMFAEGVVLLDESPSSLEARFNLAAFVGHEIAHQWFGDLVTMPWWNDLWLNESFATWMEPRILGAVRPELHPEVHALEKVHEAMDADSLVSARKIRQEIVDDNDIESAFDAITYDKGGAVLTMFERWIGPEPFQRGIRRYIAAHRFGTAGTDDLLAALTAAAGRDLAGPFRSFLDQPGLPFVEATLSCDGKPRLALKQSRFLPLGSKGPRDATLWQIPVCARYADGKVIREACTLLASAEGTLPLEGQVCPDWVMPNADAAGYYRWALAPNDRRHLALALPALHERERMSFARSMSAAFTGGGTPVAELLEALAPLASDPSYAVAAPLMDVLTALHDWIDDGKSQAAVDGLEARARELFAHPYKTLGWDAQRGDDPGRIALRAGVIEFLAITARDKAVRREALARGRAWLGLGGRPRGAELSPELLGVALRVTAEEGGAPAFEKLRQKLDGELGETVRRRILFAIGSATDPALAARARDVELTEDVHPNEIGRILAAQIKHRALRDQAWTFFGAHLDKLLTRMPPAFAKDLAMMQAAPFCDQAHADETEKLFATRAAAIEGGPRALAGAVEDLHLCAARRAAHEAEARAFFSGAKRR